MKTGKQEKQPLGKTRLQIRVINSNTCELPPRESFVISSKTLKLSTPQLINSQFVPSYSTLFNRGYPFFKLDVGCWLFDVGCSVFKSRPQSCLPITVAHAQTIVLQPRSHPVAPNRTGEESVVFRVLSRQSIPKADPCPTLDLGLWTLDYYFEA